MPLLMVRVTVFLVPDALSTLIKYTLTIATIQVQVVVAGRRA
jgi:hypothetical protein